MGGQACKSAEVVCLNATDYNLFTPNIVEKLTICYPNHRFIDIPAFRQKQSFGDLDVLFSGSSLDYDSVKKTLHSCIMIKNGSVTSYAVPIENKFFQVDLIKVPEDCYDFALSYFSYNDLGNLMGRVFHRLGFKFGHLGLKYVIRDNENDDRVLKEITVTKNFKEALEFIGYDYFKWKMGFETLEDVFQFAVSIPLATRVIFRLDETNHIARIRDRKRKTYNQFLAWVNDSANSVSSQELNDKSILRAYFLKKAFLLFLNFKLEYQRAQAEWKRTKEAKAKFNGIMVSELTGLTGPELGEFIRAFIQSMSKPDETFTDFILASSDIKNEVLTFWKDYAQRNTLHR